MKMIGKSIENGEQILYKNVNIFVIYLIKQI